MSDYYNAEKDQVDILIRQKEDEIKELEDLKADFDKKGKEEDEARAATTPAAVAADPEVSSEERLAAANQTTGQSPEAVFAEQSEPSPSTHSEQFEKSEEQVQKEADAAYATDNELKPAVGEPQEAVATGWTDPKEAQAEQDEARAEAEKENEADEDKDKVSESQTSQGVELPDGRGDPNDLGAAGTVETGTPADGTKERTVEAGTVKEETKDADEDRKADDKSTSELVGEAEKEDDKKSSSAKKGSSSKKS